MSGTPSLDSMLQLGRIDNANDGNVGARMQSTETVSDDQSLSPNADADTANTREAQETAAPLFSEQTSEPVISSERRSTLALQRSLEKYGARVNSSRTLGDRPMMTPVDHEKAGGYVFFYSLPLNFGTSAARNRKRDMSYRYDDCMSPSLSLSLCVCVRE